MIELKHDQLIVSFPEIHPDARLTITFQRTLRIPDDGRIYPLPPGLGSFPLRHVDDYATKVPAGWMQRGGVMLPMYQAEATWLSFQSNNVDGRGLYPFAVKVSAGKIDAITGSAFSNPLHREPQDYLVVPHQPWLDGFVVDSGYIRQFVAMPLGMGYTAEEQITNKAEFGGIQLVVYPMKRDVFERLHPVMHTRGVFASESCWGGDVAFSGSMDMGMAPGGKMHQEIYQDMFDFTDWDQTGMSRCFVHIANSEMWKAITGTSPPMTPPSARDYSNAGLPWFDYYDEKQKPVSGSAILNGLKSVTETAKQQLHNSFSESCTPQSIVQVRKGLKKDEVRDGQF